MRSRTPAWARRSSPSTPAPRAAIDGLGLDLRRCTLQQALDGADEIFRFGARDVLFIDSSHLLVAGSDVDLLLNRVVPRLPAGALLHVHDVFLPDGYPPAWAWRGYNEQNAIGPLLAQGAFELLFASRWTATRLASRIERSVLASLPLPPGPGKRASGFAGGERRHAKMTPSALRKRLA